MPEDFLSKRRIALETSFFRALDAELIQRVKESADAEARRNHLSIVSGIGNQALLDRLMKLGIEAHTVAALAVVPLVCVAWADNKMQAKEREAILTAAVEAGLSKESPSYQWLTQWLDVKPEPELADAWAAYTTELCQSLDAAECEALKNGLVDRAQKVAEAAGGFLGLGNKVSAAEQAVLDKLKQIFPS